jgi:hypothetical protein
MPFPLLILAATAAIGAALTAGGIIAASQASASQTKFTRKCNNMTSTEDTTRNREKAKQKRRKRKEREIIEQLDGDVRDLIRMVLPKEDDSGRDEILSRFRCSNMDEVRNLIAKIERDPSIIAKWLRKSETYEKIAAERKQLIMQKQEIGSVKNSMKTDENGMTDK